jgi:hypothetical protein
MRISDYELQAQTEQDYHDYLAEQAYQDFLNDDRNKVDTAELVALIEDSLNT